MKQISIQSTYGMIYWFIVGCGAVFQMKTMSQSIKVASIIALLSFGVLAAPISHAEKITPKTVGAGALSLIIWPGIGQAVNDESGDKVLTHALVGLFPPFRFWSGYDALVNRKGGYWDGRI